MASSPPLQQSPKSTLKPSTTTIINASDTEEFLDTNSNLLPESNQLSSTTITSTTTTTTVSPATSPTTSKPTTLSLTTTQKSSPKKITVLFKAVGSAPILRQKFFEVEPTRSVAAICIFLRKILHVNSADSLFVYVNSSFSPTPEHTMEQLCQCFGNANENKLTLQYSLVQAWG